MSKPTTALASQYGRYGYRCIAGMLQNEGCKVNHKRVERLWRREGLIKVLKTIVNEKALEGGFPFLKIQHVVMPRLG